MKNIFTDILLNSLMCINFLTRDFSSPTIEFSKSLFSACPKGKKNILFRLEKTVVFIQKLTSMQIYIKNMTDIFSYKNISGSVKVQIINN